MLLVLCTLNLGWVCFSLCICHLSRRHLAVQAHKIKKLAEFAGPGSEIKTKWSTWIRGFSISWSGAPWQKIFQITVRREI